jgi:hypothetical protein
MDRAEIDGLSRLPTRISGRPLRADGGKTGVSGFSGHPCEDHDRTWPGHFRRRLSFLRRGPHRQAVCVHQVLELG